MICSFICLDGHLAFPFSLLCTYLVAYRYDEKEIHKTKVRSNFNKKGTDFNIASHRNKYDRIKTVDVCQRL